MTISDIRSPRFANWRTSICARNPRFAADLFAAADRHELLAGGDSNAQPNTQR
jgi:hypothetical protein